MYQIVERIYHLDTARELVRRHKGAVISERDGKLFVTWRTKHKPPKGFYRVVQKLDI